MPSVNPDQLRAMPSLIGTSPRIDLDRLPRDPVMLFADWLADAVRAGVPEPHAVTLATDADGMPDARTLNLKGVDDRGWAVAGRTSSAKGTQLAARPAAAINIWWQPVARAVRMRGPVQVAPRADSEADLAARSAAARADVERDDWTLWRVQPEHVEFWQASTDRRHLRIRYDRTGSTWTSTTARGETRPPHRGA